MQQNLSFSEAVAYARGAHGALKQVRKYTGDKYITHPIEVAAIVASRWHTEEMLMAAALHDVVEDTGVTHQDIEEAFGPTVARLVEEVTDIARPGDGVRAVRVAIDRAHTANASREGKTIKLADVISNCRDIVMLAPAFAAVYLEEKRLLLEVLVGGDERLHRCATNIVANGLQQLKEMKNEQQ